MDKNKFCPSCGFPITTEICPYCNNTTGLDSKDANINYPCIECKEASLTMLNTFGPLIFSFSFLITILALPLKNENIIILLLVLSIMLPIVVIGFAIAIVHIVRKIKVKSQGRIIEALVYGYTEDNYLINEEPAQIVKLLVDTSKGKRFILYQLNSTKKKYEVNTKIKLLVYKDLFLIKK